MAAVKGVNYTKQESPTSENLLAPGILGGRIRTLTETYEAAALAAGSTIKLGRDLKAGSIIMGIQLNFDALGAATVDVGDSDTADRYMDGIDVSAVGQSDAIQIDGLHYVIGTNSGDETIQILTIANAITGTIKATIFYSEE